MENKQEINREKYSYFSYVLLRMQIHLFNSYNITKNSFNFSPNNNNSVKEMKTYCKVNVFQLTPFEPTRFL